MIPDEVGVIVAFRRWRVREDHLVSVTRDTVWPIGQPLHAECLMYTGFGPWLVTPIPTKHPNLPAPKDGCACGIYALADVTELDKRVGSKRPETVDGAVLLWGHYIQGEHGWRAEYGKPALLIGAEFNEIAHTYNVQVVDGPAEAMTQAMERWAV